MTVVSSLFLFLSWAGIRRCFFQDDVVSEILILLGKCETCSFGGLTSVDFSDSGLH